MSPFQTGFFRLALSAKDSSRSFFSLIAHLLIPEQHPIIWVYYSLFIHSPTEKHFGFFKFGVIMYKADRNTCVQVSVPL